MGPERRDGYWLWIGGPVPPGYGGITVGSVVSLRRRMAGNQRLLAHELIHVRQYRHYGLVGFAVRYLFSYVRLRACGWGHHGSYRRIPLEVEAEWLARTELPADHPRTAR